MSPYNKQVKKPTIVIEICRYSNGILLKLSLNSTCHHLIAQANSLLSVVFGKIILTLSYEIDFLAGTRHSAVTYDVLFQFF